MLSHDGSGKGAALVAAVANRIREELKGQDKAHNSNHVASSPK